MWSRTGDLFESMDGRNGISVRQMMTWSKYGIKCDFPTYEETARIKQTSHIYKHLTEGLSNAFGLWSVYIL